jgi:hypothetical protein
MNATKTKSRNQIIGMLTGLVLTTIIGSGCSNMHNITGSCQIQEEAEVEATGGKSLIPTLAKSGSGACGLDTVEANSDENMMVEEAGEEDSWGSDKDESENGNTVSQAVNKGAGDIFNNIADMLQRISDLNKLSESNPSAENKTKLGNKPSNPRGSKSLDIDNMVSTTKVISDSKLAAETGVKDLKGDRTSNGLNITKLFATL